MRFTALAGLDGLNLVGATMKSSRKIQQLKKKPEASLSVLSGESYAHPYVVIQSKSEVYEDLKTKKIFWHPKLDPYFQSPENPEYVVLKLVPKRIEY